MRVLIVADWPALEGGVERYVKLLAGGLRQAGDEVLVLAGGAGGAAEYADVIAFASDRRAPQTLLQLANPVAAAQIRRTVARFRPDVVHVNGFELHLSPLAIAAARPAAVVVSVSWYKPICPTGHKLLPDGTICTVPAGAVCFRQGCVGPLHWLRDQPRYRLIHGALHSADSIVTCSDWMREALAPAGFAAHSLPWPVEEPRAGFRRERSPTPLFTYVGRLSREKGVDTLLAAFALLLRDVRTARLRIVGDGPARRELEVLVDRHSLAEAVEFTGWLAPEGVEAGFADSWAVVAPSRWAEPLGLVAIEAIAHGVPVIASSRGGLAETVEPNRTGLLFTNGDVRGLARQLRAVSVEEVFPAGIIAAAAAERMRQRHDLGRHVEALRTLFASLSSRSMPSRVPAAAGGQAPD